MKCNCFLDYYHDHCHLPVSGDDIIIRSIYKKYYFTVRIYRAETSTMRVLLLLYKSDQTLDEIQNAALWLQNLGFILYIIMWGCDSRRGYSNNIRETPLAQQ